MKSITIKNTKGVKKLKFNFPENPGVYLLVGPNGSGKTTLLVCMERICNPYAFARGFVSSRYGSGYDEYTNSEILFEVDNTCVLFRKKVARWSASPRKDNATLLNHFGFLSSVFIKADSKRIDATQDEIKSGTQQSADSATIEALNAIFETEKYSKLKKLKVSRGQGRKAASINIIKDGNSYYSEKRFSTGEIAMIRLIEELQNVSDHSLILLDEAEIALHPRVQTNLIKYLDKNAKEKNLTIFVSTHSPTMIKSLPPKNIILFDDNHGNVKMITPCYPAKALGSIDYEESKMYDYIFFVEDEMARCFLKYMLGRYSKINESISTALYSIIPVGGYESTGLLAVKSKGQVFSNSKVFAVVDDDAFNAGNQKFNNLYSNHSDTIFSLGYTPEIKFIDALTTSSSDFQKDFRERMHCEISTIVNSNEYTNCINQNQRKLAKKQFEVFVEKCCESTGDCEQIVIDSLISFVVNTISENDLRRIFNPIFSKVG